MIAVCIYAGLRRGELAGLRWRDLDFPANRLTVARSYRRLPKGGKIRHLPLHAELACALRQWRERCPETPEGLVFPIPGKRGYRMLNRAELLGLPELLRGARCHTPDKPWHALRHTFAAHAVMSGIPLYTVKELLGHASIEMTQRYAHLAPDYLGREVARLNFAAPASAGSAKLVTLPSSDTAENRSSHHTRPSCSQCPGTAIMWRTL
jgi:integrase